MTHLGNVQQGDLGLQMTMLENHPLNLETRIIKPANELTFSRGLEKLTDNEIPPA